MTSERRIDDPCRVTIRAAASTALLTIVFGSGSAAWAQSTDTSPDRATFQYADLTRELANKMAGRYVVAAVGDVLLMEPVGRLTDPKIQTILREADTAIGNLEGIIIDRRDFPAGFGNNYAPKETAADLSELGFDMMNGANNHAWDAGEEGLRSSIRWMDMAGIPLSGVGPNLATARMPVFHQTPKGRVGMIGANTGGPAARDLQGNMRTGGWGWGLNPLRSTRWNIVSADQLLYLKGVRDQIVARRLEPRVAVPIRVPPDEPDRVQLFSANFMAGPKTGEYRYELDAADLEGNLVAIRNTKEFGDFAIFTMHHNLPQYAFEGVLTTHYPSQALVDFTHQLIENGADMFFGHGPHTLLGVEIYKGRPIFYGLGSFAQQQIHLEGSQEGSDEIPPGMTPIEADEVDLERLRAPLSLIGVLATSTYQDGRLVEVRLYPLDLGYDRDRPWSQLGIAQTPSPDLARDILTKMQTYSEPFGTEISIEGGVGVIRVPPEATVPIGVDLRATFPGP